MPIDAFGRCRWVDNNSALSIFVPFKSELEWRSFDAHHPSDISAVHCARPHAVEGSPATSSASPTYASDSNPGCDSVTVGNPNVFGRTGVSRWPAPDYENSANYAPIFSCHGGATKVQSRIQWIAGDADRTLGGMSSWAPDFKFGPDLTLIVEDVTRAGPSGVSISAGSGDTLKLSWTVSFGSNCTASSSDHSWSGGMGAATALGSAVAPARGSATVQSTATVGAPTTYALTCTAANGLSSTATVTVTGSAAPAACGAADGRAVPSVPTANMCTFGVPSAVTGSGPWSWTCSDGVVTASCSAPVSGVADACGSANGVPSAIEPTGHLCAIGATPVPFSMRRSGILSPWSWTCRRDDGSAATCSAPQVYICMAAPRQRHPAGQDAAYANGQFDQVYRNSNSILTFSMGGSNIAIIGSNNLIHITGGAYNIRVIGNGNLIYQGGGSNVIDIYGNDNIWGATPGTPPASTGFYKGGGDNMVRFHGNGFNTANFSQGGGCNSVYFEGGRLNVLTGSPYLGSNVNGAVAITQVYALP